MFETIQTLVVLLAVVAWAAILAPRMRIPTAVALVLIGVILALVPGLPTVELAPEFVLLVILPPIIYSSAVAMSWREFKANLRPISLLAVGCVLFTTAAVAAAAHWLLNLPWPIGFLLGAIVSPPDAVAALEMAHKLTMPRRIVVILEGEGLANDATALVLYRFATTAVVVGSFSASQAVSTFGAIVVGELLWGIGVGWAMLRLRSLVAEPRIEIVLSILTPYLAFWPPEMLGGSGVLATVVTGLYFSWNGPRLISAATRLQGIFFWDLLIYVINGMVFLMTGLQAHALIIDRGIYPPAQLAISALVICAVVIGARFIWMYPATYLPRWLVPAIRRNDPSPPGNRPFAIAFAGIRGIVSVAAALALPLTVENGAPFPHRDLILFLTFTVVMATLVGQGLMLPVVIRALGLSHAGRKERHAERMEEVEARRSAIHSAAKHLEDLAAERNLPPELVAQIRAEHKSRLRRVEQDADIDAEHHKQAELADEIQSLLIEAERRWVNDLYRRGGLKDESRRRIELDLDLRAAALLERD